MTPKSIGSLQLDVFEAVGRIPLRYLGSPTDGNAVNPNAVIDKSAHAHFDWLWREDFKAQPRRSESFKIGSVAKEVENPLAWRWKPDFRVKREFVHRRLLMPGFDPASASKAPAAQRLHCCKNARDTKQDRQPKKRPICESCSDKKTKRNDRADDSPFLINVGSKESLHIASAM